jgi:lauroyl/myristoyl acyltransferase
MEMPLFGEPRALANGPARLALARRAEVLVGTVANPAQGGTKRVEIVRVKTEDLVPGKDGEHVLMARIARELDQRVRMWPEAWLGVFTKAGAGGLRERPDPFVSAPGSSRPTERLAFPEHPR